MPVPEAYTHTPEQLDALRAQLVDALASADPAIDPGDAHAGADDDFSLFTTIRYDPGLCQDKDKDKDIQGDDGQSYPYFLLDQHVRRLQRAAAFFGFPLGDFSTSTLAAHLHHALGSPSTAHRVKVLISRDGECTIEFTPLPREHLLQTHVPHYRDIQNNILNGVPQYRRPWLGWTIYKDTEAITPSPFTSFKTTNRSAQDSARERFAIVPGDRREVLLIDGANHALEGTITSVAFWRKVETTSTTETTFAWVTPHLGLGNMDGVTRTWLLSTGQIRQGVVKVSELKDGEYVLLLNGLMGIQPAKLVIQ